jgi:tetratricopeptide (TPR) repeat protein
MKRRLIIIVGVLLLSSGLLFAQEVTDVPAAVNTVKTLIKSNPQQAIAKADEIVKVKKNKKNAELVSGIARAFLEAKDVALAEKYLAIGKSANNKDPLLSMLEGDIAVEKNDPGTACQMYEQAIYLDKNCFDAYVKYANVYREANPEEAINKLENLKSVNPAKAFDVDRTEAKIFYSKNQFDKAAEAYARIIDNPAVKKDDIRNYSFALFLSHQFAKSLEVAKKGLEKDPRSAVFNRLAMYNNTDLKNYDEAEKAADAFFNASDSAQYSYLDYKYYGYLMTAQKKYDKAIGAYKTALEKDSTQHALWKELSDAYDEMEDYPSAIDAFNNYLKTLPAAENTPDLKFSLGKLYYGAGDQYADKKDADKSKESFMKADSLFKEYSAAVPDNYKGYFYDARCNSKLDPDTKQGLAKPYYEKALEIALAKNDSRYNSVILESYRYLAYYCYLKNQLSQAKDYCNKIVAIDPTNDFAKKLSSALK